MQFKKGQPPWNKNTHLSGMSGKHHSINSKQMISKSNKKENPKSTSNALLRRSVLFKNWRLAVFAKDNFTCQDCGQKGGILHPHHIMSFAKYPGLRLSIENGQTLCEKCHGKIHNIDFAGYHRNLTCTQCGTVFKARYGNYAQKTCSKKCGYKYRAGKGNGKKGKHYPHLQRAETRTCTCGKHFRAINDTYKRKQKYCSHECYLISKWQFTGAKVTPLRLDK